MPATVQAVLAARIDRLPPEEKRLLQSAAVIGEDIPFSLLQAIAEGPTEALHRGLSALQEAGFCYEASLFPELVLPLHARAHARGRLWEPAAGAAAAAALAHRRGHGAARRPSTWLIRWNISPITRCAARYGTKPLRATGRPVARRRHARPTGKPVACWEQALVALQRLPESRESIEQAIDLRLQLRTELWPLGDHRRISEYLQQAEDLAKHLGDQRRLGLLASLMTQHFRLIDDQERAIASAQHALEHAKPWATSHFDRDQFSSRPGLR